MNNAQKQRKGTKQIHCFGSPIYISPLVPFVFFCESDGQITNWTQQAGTISTNVYALEYDPVDQLVGATLRDSVAGTLLKRFVYGYDSAGNRTSESVGTSSASSVSSAKVNNLNQLTNTVAGSGPVRFTGYLNEPGQSVTVGTNAAQIKQTTNFTGNAELAVGTNTVAVKATDYSGNSTTNSYQIVVTNNGVAKTLKYDLNGNLTNAFTATATNVYEWDAADRNTAINVITASATNRSEFTYDGAGRRTRILELTNGVGQNTNSFIWEGTKLSEERDSTGATVTKRFFGQGEQISGTAYFYTRDHLGSVHEMVDSSGNVRARYDYDPYGRRTKISGDLEASFGFTGHYWHQNSRLWLAPLRSYDSETARWISRDPIKEDGGLNLYQYAGNDPINKVDPLGLWAYFQPSTWFDGRGYQPGEWEDLNGQIAQAMLDGLIPGADPFMDHGGYDPCDEGLAWSRELAAFSRNVYLAAFGLRALFWAPGTSIFYSGAGAEQAALAMAEAGEGSTILNTIGGSALRALGVESKAVWEVASTLYSYTAGAEAIAVIGEGGGLVGTSVLGSVEFPILAARGVDLIFKTIMLGF